MAKFQKGHPGGPGRPKLTQEEKDIRKICLQHAEAAVKVLTTAMAQQAEEPQSALSAAKEVLDRAFGKSSEHKTVDVTVTHLDARKRLESKLAGFTERKPEEPVGRVIN